MVDAQEMSPEWLLAKASEREHILVAVALAQDKWRELGEVIVAASDADDARRRIVAEFGLDGVQAAAVLDTQFRRISGADRDRITNELDELRHHISQLKDQIAADPESARVAPPATSAPEGRRGWWGYEPRE
jgi:DNA gyrase subunit A